MLFVSPLHCHLIYVVVAAAIVLVIYKIVKKPSGASSASTVKSKRDSKEKVTFAEADAEQHEMHAVSVNDDMVGRDKHHEGALVMKSEDRFL